METTPYKSSNGEPASHLKPLALCVAQGEASEFLNLWAIITLSPISSKMTDSILSHLQHVANTKHVGLRVHLPAISLRGKASLDSA